MVGTAAPSVGDHGRPLSAPSTSADKLLLECCRNIRKEAGWSHRTLKQACDWATSELERGAYPGAGLSRYYRVIELALETRSEELVEKTLPQLQKLIAGGLVPRGMTTTLKDGSRVILAEVLVGVVMRAGAADKTVRRGGRAQAVRCLLACVASPEIEVHGEELRNVFRFVQETFLTIVSTANRAKHNKAQTRATLGHMLQISFSRVETEPLAAPTASTVEENASAEQPRHHQGQIAAITTAEQTTAATKVETSTGFSQSLSSGPREPAEGEEGAAGSARGGPQANSEQTIGEGFAEAVPAVVLEGVLPEVLEVLATEPNTASEVQALNGRQEEAQEEDEERLTVAQADALMLLGELCRWSLGEEGLFAAAAGSGSAEIEAILLESKTAALELIVAVLTNHGGARFRALPRAALLMRGELCASLLHHCTSGVTGLVSLSLRVFVAMVAGFKNHLKAEMEVFITSIFLRILESEHSVFDHKMLVLEVISELCRDPLALVEMFVNYDCDLQAIDLFKRIVTALAKVAKGRSLPDGASKKEQEEVRSLQMMGMGGTVDVVSSMVKAADLEVLYGEMEMAPRNRDGRQHLPSNGSDSMSTSGGGPLSPVRTSPAATGAFRRAPPRRANSDMSITTVGGSLSSPRAGGPAASGRVSTVSELPTDGNRGSATIGVSSSSNDAIGLPAAATAPTTPIGRAVGASNEALGVSGAARTMPLGSTWSEGTGSMGSAGARGSLAHRSLSSQYVGEEGMLRAATMGLGGGGAGGEEGTGRVGVGGRESIRGGLRFDGAIQGEAMQAFDTKRRVQRELEAGIVRFNLKPKDGLAYLESKGHLDSKNPVSVAGFLRIQADRLDKTEVGEFMGRGTEYMGGFCVKVLHAYVDGMDFTGMMFDEAIRHFLRGFRLPGEAQKIDRMMEKFAERFCLQNGSVFPNPDTAFILAFSIVMLNTDLHNPNIPEAKRMTKEGFIRNNRGIDQGKSLPDEFLGGVYDRIARSPISLKEDDKLRHAKEGGSSASGLQEMLPFVASSQNQKRRAAQDREREDMLLASRALLTRQRTEAASLATNYLHFSMASGDDGELSPDMAEHVLLMFEETWGPVLSVFSEVLESSEDRKLIELCLKGLKKAVRIAGGLDVPVARETLLNALVRFTLLDSSREMEDKNIRCVKVLLGLALTEGNMLRESWGLVLRCISQIARLQLFVSGLQPDEDFDSRDDPSRQGGGLKSSAANSSMRNAGVTKHASRRQTMAVPFPGENGAGCRTGGSMNDRRDVRRVK